MREGELQLWGGIECTVNRVGDKYFDQLERSGHARRPEDLDLIAALGIRTLRYPVLWERVAPNTIGACDWSWTDARLARLRALGINPIVGLTHHGSGPLHTNLVAASFPNGLASYARSVAVRYPWVTDYTPVNEPLTTARFSGLYGHWYPHGHNARTFARALVTQCRAIVVAMAAVREITPNARLIQTEDLGRTYSTPALVSIAELYRTRRWLSLDLLCGRVGPGHPSWERLQRWGISQGELDWFVQHACPPDIIGVNHYVTSDRFLDDDVAPYPSSRVGTYAGRRFADVEAVRARLDLAVDVPSLLQEVWERYRLPLAVTESHLGGTREEQMRWLAEAWNGAKELRAGGTDVRAVTVWSLFGAFDWNRLVTREDSFYEPGAFDVRAPRPRPTALAHLAESLTSIGEAVGPVPVLDVPGWWRRPDRLFQASLAGRAVENVPLLPIADMRDRPARPLLILGASGTLGSAFVRLCDARGLPYHLLGRREFDFAVPTSIERLLVDTRAWAVINAAGYVDVDAAEVDSQVCTTVNTHAPVVLADACARRGVPFVTFSSDQVFDGALAAPYTEARPVGPLNAYGRSKASMEVGVMRAHPAALVIRTSAFFGPWDQMNFVSRTLDALEAGKVVRAPNDLIVSPTYVPDLVHATLDLLVDGEHGIWHIANDGAVAWSELGRYAAEMAKISAAGLDPCSWNVLGLRAPRPPYSALGSERASVLPNLADALARYLEERAR